MRGDCEIASNARTQIADLNPVRTLRPVTPEPCLILRSDGLQERVVFLEDAGIPLIFGRGAQAGVSLSDGNVSREHLSARRVGATVYVRDLGSTNGTWLDGARLTDEIALASGQFLHLGTHTLSLGWRDRTATAQAQEIAQDLEKANRYVLSMLPERLSEGAITVDWSFLPSAKLGGDVFGYHAVDSRHMAFYLIDVSGHGAGAAMHSTSILAALRNQTLRDTDFKNPASVLQGLNDTFDMETHGGYCFTTWYGVFDREERRLAFASGGHHPAYLVTSLGSAPMPLRTRNPVMGAMPGIPFDASEIPIPETCRLHIFSDGCFEITDRAGQQWSLETFLPLLTQGPEGVEISCQSVFEAVRGAAQPGPLADDFSILSVSFR